MIEIKLVAPITEEIPYITVPNQELIKGILAMPENEYREVITGVLSVDKLNVKRFMILFAYAGNCIRTMELDPAQKSVVEEYIKNFKL
jgi:hypothetical protein